MTRRQPRLSAAPLAKAPAYELAFAGSLTADERGAPLADSVTGAVERGSLTREAETFWVLVDDVSSEQGFEIELQLDVDADIESARVLARQRGEGDWRAVWGAEQDVPAALWRWLRTDRGMRALCEERRDAWMTEARECAAGGV